MVAALDALHFELEVDLRQQQSSLIFGQFALLDTACQLVYDLLVAVELILYIFVLFEDLPVSL